MKGYMLLVRKDLRDEHLQKDVHILRRNKRTTRNRLAFINIRQAHTSWLVNEQ